MIYKDFNKKMMILIKKMKIAYGFSKKIKIDFGFLKIKN